MEMENIPYGGEALDTKRLPLPRLETYASRELALSNLGDSVHFWPSRRKTNKNLDASSTDPHSKAAGQKAQLQDELASLRAARGASVASAKASFGSAIDEAKKQVRGALALARAETQSKKKQDHLKREQQEMVRTAKVKGEFNDLKYKRSQQEEKVKRLMFELEKLGGDLEEDVASLESLIPERDRLQIEAESQEVAVEQETRKASMYDHMQTRARNSAEEASKEVDLLHMEAKALARDLHSLEIYLRDTRRLRAKSEEALNWMQENYNARSEEKADRLSKRRETRDQVGRELAETRIQMKELKAQWKLEVDQAAAAERQRTAQEQELTRQAEEREVAEEEMRVKLERLAHTVGLQHRPEGSSLGELGFEEDDGWTPESIMQALQAVSDRRDDCLRQIEGLRAREAGLWESLPEWRTRLQAARQGWSDMWKARLDAPGDNKLAIKAPPAATNIASEEAQLKEIKETQAALKKASDALAVKQGKFEESVTVLSRIFTGLDGIEKIMAETAPTVVPISHEPGTFVPNVTSADAAAAKLLGPGSPVKIGLPTADAEAPASGEEAADKEAPPNDELKPFLYLGEQIHRVMDLIGGLAAAAELELDAPSGGTSASVAPAGVKPIKVKQPVGYIHESQVSTKYTTKDGVQVAGPHIDPDDEDEEAAEPADGKYLKKIMQNSETPRSKR